MRNLNLNTFCDRFETVQLVKLFSEFSSMRIDHVAPELECMYVNRYVIDDLLKFWTNKFQQTKQTKVKLWTKMILNQEIPYQTKSVNILISYYLSGTLKFEKKFFLFSDRSKKWNILVEHRTVCNSLQESPWIANSSMTLILSRDEIRN